MAPKKARSSSPPPKAKAKSGKAKAEPKKEEVEDPKAKVEKEGKETWERYEEEGVIKLKQFAELVRAVNVKKCHMWGDDPGEVIRRNWKSAGGFEKREISQEQFMVWWAMFQEEVEAKWAEVQAEEEKKEQEKAEKAAEAKKMFDGDGIWLVPTEKLQDALNAAFNKDKTPLIIDDRDQARSEVYFTYTGAYIIECKKMIMDKVKGASIEEVLNAERERFWRASCFRYGQTVVFRLANSAIDLKKVYNSETFPTLKLLDTNEWKPYFGPDTAKEFKGKSSLFKMCRNSEDEMEMLMGIGEKFRVVAITHFEDKLNDDGVPEYVSFLKDAFPLDLCQPIKIQYDPK